jgi:hypothetical protein|tara:strand:+ start:300 stop:521 length:222 start_codon:yes stop_codon:yes gene_type:complete
MVKRLIIIIFLLTQPVKAECKYYAEADVKDGKIVNKQEHYTCKEKENFFIRFMTDEKYHNAFVTLVMIVAENI